MQNFSILDLSPICEGETASEAVRATAALARSAENSGYHRFWLAEHHNAPGIASAATAVMIGHVAGATSTIRIGAGGIMLPNHSPLVIAEQFGTLASLYPGRVDLGLGRAPGTDMATARALRRHMETADNFPQDVLELLSYFGDPKPEDRVRAYPGVGTHVPIWILGSSLYGAQLAAQLGLPYAFASHFAPAMLEQALQIYRSQFQPSPYLDKPYVMIGTAVWAADSLAEAEFLRSSHMMAVANLRSGISHPLPRPVKDVEMLVSPRLQSVLADHLAFSAIGTKETLRTRFSQMIEMFEPDELIVTGMIYDAGARIRSFEAVADVLKSLKD
ncbi:LLM class flavin-dependent oxidoreductase [Cognatishimia activa]|uniref:LLM class flavin-dependent oxidoreductase n=1 Tax=Cognatishimia activa TaxID=1715691 RepID=UPI00223192BB|nr:LLM class flavin-dependent oxidoreductase [Cognatishimia activa]UZD90907.1 LLM class flavin-dependent oxidoreductase [Cognatishimia activa]